MVAREPLGDDLLVSGVAPSTAAGRPPRPGLDPADARRRPVPAAEPSRRRAGTRLTVAGGLTLTTAGLGYFATATAASGYPHYLIATMGMSAGIGLAMAPATASIISALPAR